MFRWIIASAAVLLLSPLAAWAQLSGTIDGKPPAAHVPVPNRTTAPPTAKFPLPEQNRTTAPPTAIPNAAETPPTPFTGPATNTRPRMRPTYARPYQQPFTSYSPNYTWANRPSDLVKPVAGFNSPTGTRMFNGYPPSYYAGFVTTGLPTYLTSINYPTVYGAYQYNGVMWAGPGGTTEGASIAVRPWSTYPNTTYNPVAPPTEAAFSHFSQGYETPPGSTGLGGPANLTSAGPATIDIRVPSYADVWIQGTKMAQSGELRRFISPTLNPHQMYSYDVTARWIGRDGNWVNVDRRVIVKPGDHEAINFIEPGTSQSILKARELP